MRHVVPQEYTQNEGVVLYSLLGTVSAGEIDLGYVVFASFTVGNKLEISFTTHWGFEEYDKSFGGIWNT